MLQMQMNALDLALNKALIDPISDHFVVALRGAEQKGF